MRVLVVNDRPLDDGWGAEIYARRLVHGLRTAGDAVEVVAGEVMHRGPAKLLDVWDPRARRLVRQRAASFGADVVHHHNVLRELSPSVLGVPRGVPAVLTVHDLRLAGARDHAARDPRALPAIVKARLDAAIARRRVDVIVAVSEPVAAALRAAGFADVRVVGVPVEPPERTPEDVRQCHDVVFAGRLSRDKGVDVLLDAFRLTAARDKDATLVIAGDGPEADRLRAQAAPLGKRVRMLGRLDTADLSTVLGRARVVAVPSVPQRRREGSSLAVAEAAMHGRPVVGSDDPAVAALVERLGCGVTVGAGSAPLLADAIVALLHDGTAAEAYGAAGAAAAARLHSVDAVTAAMRAIYAEVAGRSS